MTGYLHSRHAETKTICPSCGSADGPIRRSVYVCSIVPLYVGYAENNCVSFDEGKIPDINGSLDDVDDFLEEKEE